MYEEEPHWPKITWTWARTSFDSVGLLVNQLVSSMLHFDFNSALQDLYRKWYIRVYCGISWIYFGILGACKSQGLLQGRRLRHKMSSHKEGWRPLVGLWREPWTKIFFYRKSQKYILDSSALSISCSSSRQPVVGAGCACCLWFAPLSFQVTVIHHFCTSSPLKTPVNINN